MINHSVGNVAILNSKQTMNQQESTQLLLQLTARINSATKTDELLREIMESAKTILSGEASSLILHDEESKELIIQYPTGSASTKISGMRIPDAEGIAGWVWQNQKALIINDAKADKRFRGDLIEKDFYTQSLICVPLCVNANQNIGVLQVINKIDGKIFTDDDLSLLEALAHQAAIALERQRLTEEMVKRERQLAQERQRREKEAALAFAKGVEEERARIARELHDHILGLISTTMRKLQHKKHQSTSEDTVETALQTLEELDELSREIRQIMEDLKPMSLQHFGLAHALEIVANRQIDASEKPIRLIVDLNIDTWQGVEFQYITIYRIMQEAIQNAVVHGNPATISLSGTANEHSMTVILKDDGKGFDMQEVEENRSKHYLEGGNGLLNMAHRASTIDAHLSWDSAVGKGTTLLLNVVKS
ncbi:GAF domain-containing protein [bacterium]|nr:MAG: GAF domain-containing protein [bacterium]